MRHKYFHCIQLDTIGTPQFTYRALKIARVKARSLTKAWVGTTDGKIDERWENGRRYYYRLPSGKMRYIHEGDAP